MFLFACLGTYEKYMSKIRRHIFDIFWGMAASVTQPGRIYYARGGTERWDFGDFANIRRIYVATYLTYILHMFDIYLTYS